MIQITAMITMLLDHIGLIYNIYPLRIIGRFSMPLYAYLVYYSYKHNENNKQYRKRLLYLALISQLPFMGLTYEKFGLRFNICLSWYLCIIILDNIHHDNRGVGHFFGAFLAFNGLILLPCDYGLVALLWVLLWRYMDNKQYKHIAINLCLLGVISCVMGDYIQIITLLAVPLVCVLHHLGASDRIKDKRFKKLFRLWYPLHLGVLSCLR